MITNLRELPQERYEVVIWFLKMPNICAVCEIWRKKKGFKRMICAVRKLRPTNQPSLPKCCDEGGTIFHRSEASTWRRQSRKWPKLPKEAKIYERPSRIVDQQLKRSIFFQRSLSRLWSSKYSDWGFSGISEVS